MTDDKWQTNSELAAFLGRSGFNGRAAASGQRPNEKRLAASGFHSHLIKGVPTRRRTN